MRKIILGNSWIYLCKVAALSAAEMVPSLPFNYMWFNSVCNISLLILNVGLSAAGGIPQPKTGDQRFCWWCEYNYVFYFFLLEVSQERCLDTLCSIYLHLFKIRENWPYLYCIFKLLVNMHKSIRSLAH